MMDELRMPTDLEVRMLTVEVDHFKAEYERIKQLYMSHEVELAILWCGMLGLAAIVGLQGYQLYQMNKTEESNG